MADQLPPYDLADLSGTPIDQLDQFDNILNEAQRKGVVSYSPENEQETYNLTSQRIRIQTISSRLWLLGYLPRKIKSERIHKKLDDIRQAVARFQTEAGLKQDHWVGEITWYALDQLVSFESDITRDQWFTDGQVKPEVAGAFHRAVQLRLWSLGIYKHKPNDQSALLTDSALSNFNTILSIFSPQKVKPKVAMDESLADTLFDQDFLIDMVAARQSRTNRQNFSLDLSPGNKAKKEALAQKFIINCAKIEFWLLGYEVRIDGKRDYMASSGNDLYDAMVDYYRKFTGVSNSVARKLSMQISPGLFVSLAESAKISESYEVDDASDEIAKQITTQEQVEEAYGYVRKKGLRLWDGIKRLWRWIKKKGKQVISFITKNIFKGFFRFVTKSFKILKKGISSIVQSVGVYLKGRLSAPGISFQFSKDLDTTSFIADSASREELQQGIGKLKQQSKSFGIGCRVLGLVFHVFKSALQGVFGWAKLLISLVRKFKSLKELYLDFKSLSST